MIRRPFNTIRRFSNSHKPNSEIDYASWYKSEDFKVKIDNMSNKIDDNSDRKRLLQNLSDSEVFLSTGSIIT